jgi:hypothetical protein
MRFRPRRDRLTRPPGLDPAHDDKRNPAESSQDESDAHAPIVCGTGSDPAQDGSSGFAYCTSTGFGGYGTTRVSPVSPQPRRS